MSKPEGEQTANGPPQHKLHKLCRTCIYIVAGIVLCLALLTGVAKLALDALEQRPQYAADWLGEQLGRDISLGAMVLSWNDGAPLLRLRGVKVKAMGLQAGGLVLAQAEIRFDALASLHQLAPKISKITVRGANVRLRRGADGQWLIAGVASPGRYAADDAITQALAALPRGVEFSLENARLGIEGVVENRAHGDRLEFSPVNLNLRKLTNVSRLAGTIGLPGMQQAALRFSLRWAHDAGTPLKKSKLALITKGVPLAKFPWLAGLLDLNAVDGKLGLTLDINIQDGTVADAAGQVSLSNAALSIRKAWPTLQFENLHSLVDIKNIPRGWQLNFLQLAIRKQQQDWPLTALSLTRTENKLTHSERLTIDQLPLSAVTTLLQESPNSAGIQLRFLAGLEAGGMLENIELTHTEQLPKQDSTTLSLDFNNLGYRDKNTGFRVGAMRGSMALFDRSGIVRIKSSQLHLNKVPATTKPANLQANAVVRWYHQDNQLVLDLQRSRLENSDLHVDTQGTVRWPDSKGNISVDLHSRASDMQTNELKALLNTGLAPQAVAQWISSALHGGRITRLKADLSGIATKLEDVQKLVTFSGRFKGVNLDYAKGWPQLNRLNGRVKLAAQGLEFELSKGDVAGARIQKASGQIKNIHAPAPVIKVSGTLQGRSEQAATFIAASPLKSQFSGLLRNLEMLGPADLGLTLSIPLSAKPLAVLGTLNVHNNLIHVPALRSGLSQVKGQIKFNTAGPQQGRFEALYLARPIRLNVDGGINNGSTTRLVIHGRTDRIGLARHLFNVGAVNSNLLQDLPLLSRLSGETNWRVELDIPTRWSKDLTLDLRIESDLRGMALNLPAPLGKSRTDSRRLSVSTQLSQLPTRLFKIEYGKQLNAALEVKPDGPHYRLSRGDISLDNTRATLPDKNGLQVNGQLNYLSVDAWVNVLGQFRQSTPSPSTAQQAKPMAEVNRVRLGVKALDALGSRFDNVRMKVIHDDLRGWKIDLQGRELDGQIAFKDLQSEQGIQARFKRLSIQPTPASTAPADIDPRTLPALNLIIDKLQYKELNLGLIKLVLQPFPRGTRVKQLFALSDGYEIRGHGDWQRTHGQSESALQLQVNGNDFGKLLKTIGYPETGIDGGAVDMLIKGRWPGSPFDFDTTTLQGTLHFRASNGFLRDIEPGVTGRVFGLFTLTTLPRRLLRLDFSDLFTEGLGYNLLEGSFNLEAGNAYTNNLKMETDTSRVEMEGRVGLILRDYDQVMTVTPKLSSSLPLAPLWLAEKFLDKKLINDAFAYRYTITGGWDDPKVERIQVKVPKVELK